MQVIKGGLSLLWKLYIAVIFILSAILFYPIILPFLFSEQGKHRAFKLFILWSWTVRVCCFYHVKKVGNAELPEGPFIIIANHASYLDIFLLPSIISKQRFLFLGKAELLQYPLIKTYFKRLHIPVYRNSPIKSAKSLVHAAKAIKAGWSLVIFPEGGIPDVQAPNLVPFKEGAFQLAKSRKVPIVPITFANNFKLFSDPTVIFGPAKPGISRVYIHPYLSKERINEMSQEAIKKHCFEIIDQTLRKENPDLMEAKAH